MQMLGGKGGGVASMPESTSVNQSQSETVSSGSTATNDFDDDIPF